MADPHDDPFSESALDAALERAWEPKKKPGESVVSRLEQVPGVRSRVLLHEPPEEDATPLLRVGAAEGPDRPEEDSRYQLVGEIARGGVGVIYRGRDRDLGRDVALKVLRTEHAGKDVVVTRFVEEAQIGAQLQHPGIVPVYSLGLQPDGRPHFAMKLVKGRTLGALLEARRDASADQRRFLEIFLQACQTVSYAHARGVLHRDLKPANVMVGAFGEVLVVDWGFGKVLGREPRVEEPRPAPKTVIATVRTGSEGSQSVVGSVMGTPAYMPPEQALGHVEDVDARSDVFSLGAILSEILTGKPPYTGDMRDLLVQAAQTRTEPALERLAACDADDALKDLVRQCLQPVPGDRPADAGVVATALGDWMAAADERARQAEVEAVEERARLEREKARAAWERRARTKMRIGAAAAALAILLGAGALWLVDAKRHARAEEARPAIENALLEASRLEGEGDLVAALGAAERARDLALTSEVPGDLHANADALAARLASELDARRAEAARAEKAKAFVKELEEVRLARWEGFDDRAGDRGFQRVFAAHDLDPLKTEAEELAARVQERYGDVTLEVAGTLDVWAVLRWLNHNAWNEPWQAIFDAARTLDPDPTRLAIREALTARDGEALATLAADEAALDLTGPITHVLTVTLRKLNGNEGGTQARSLLQRRLLRRPDDFWAHALWPTVAGAKGRASRERELDHALAAAALRPDLARAHSHLALCWRHLERYEQAFAVAQEALRLAPNDAGILNNYGVAANAVGREAEAEEAWLRVLDIDPDHALAHTNLASVYANRKDYAAARRACERAIDLRPEFAPAHSGLAATLNQLKLHERAIVAARRAIELDPDLSSGHSFLADALRNRAQGSEADLQASLEAARRAVALGPRRAGSHASLAMSLYALERGDEALSAARTAVRLDPDLAIARAAIGYAQEARRDFEAAIAAWEKALGMDSTLDDARNRVGAALLNMNRVAEAKQYFEDLLESKRDPAVLIMLSQALSASGELDDAEDALEKVTEAERRDHAPQMCFARAVLAEARGDLAGAEEAYRRNLKLHARAGVGRLRLSMLLRRLGRPEEAIALCHEGLAIAECGFLHHELGSAHGELLHLEEAEYHYQRALELIHLALAETPIRLNLAYLDMIRGRYAEASIHLERVLVLAEEGSALPRQVGKADAMNSEARRQLRLSRSLPAIVAGEQDPDDEQGWGDAWIVCWALGDREGARGIHRRAIPHMTQPTAWLVRHAWLCIRNAYATGLRNPVAADERLALRREARDLLMQVLEAIRTGVEDEKQARQWLGLVRDDLSTRSVRDADALAEMPEGDRAAWTALWHDFDQVLGDDNDAAEGR